MLAIGVAVVAVVLVVWAVSSIGGDESPDTTAAAASSSLTLPSAASSTSVVDTGQPGSSGGGSGSGSDSSETSPAAGTPTSAAPVAPGQCPDQSLAIKATVEQPTYQVGQEPVFGIVITNISPTPCERELGAGLQQAMVYTIDGQVRLWSNIDCFPNPESRIQQLKPGEQALFTVKWSGTTSQPDCAGDRAPVAPGAYTVVAQLGALRSGPEPFNIA